MTRINLLGTALLPMNGDNFAGAIMSVTRIPFFAFKTVNLAVKK